MKSVSFSDLRNNNDSMSNFDSNMKRSSSIKQLTYYNSSEDILKKFSTKTSEKFLLKDPKKFDENQIDSETFQNTSEINQSQEEPYQSVIQIESHEKTIKELREQLTQKNNIIANLQDENLLLQTESNKNSEQVKYLENRIKYLEHALAAFTNTTKDKQEQNEMKNDSFDKENNENKYYSNPQNVIKSKPLGSRVNFEITPQINEKQNNNSCFKKNNYENDNIQFIEKPNDFNKYDYENNQIADLKKRPTSADSALQSTFPNTYKQYEHDSSTQTRQSYSKLYDSDSEPNNPYQINSCNENPKQSSSTFVNFQRQKLERDRSMNLTEFKSRLDEFTKYARKSAEQNSLRNSTSSLPPSNEYKSISKYHVTPEKWNDSKSDLKVRVKSINQFSRPPVDPGYKQRRNNFFETKISNESITNYSIPSQSEPDEDVILKERVKKILEKHNYPINNTYYSTSNENMGNNMVNSTCYRDEYSSHPYKKYGNNETQQSSDWHNRNSSPIQYPVASNVRNIYNDSGIPKLDLSRNEQSSYFPDDTSDLLNKYLNYQGYANVS